ncbi:MAG: ATP-binding cassette domain-containing protein, partial [Burkholderiaceae bacterium]
MVVDKTNALLQVKGITVRFGGITALDNVSFDLPRDKVCGLIGPNGAGKTTLFNCLSRLYDYQEGDLLFEGQSITKTPVHQMTNIGIGRTFQNLAMFKTMTVQQNVMVGAHSKSSTGFIGGLLPSKKTRLEEQDLRDRADVLIERLKLSDVAHRAVGD